MACIINITNDAHRRINDAYRRINDAVRSINDAPRSISNAPKSVIDAFLVMLQIVVSLYDRHDDYIVQATWSVCCC